MTQKESKLPVKKNSETLRIVIYGAGAVGGMVGGLLALSDTPVIMIGRPNNVDVIRKQGLKLISTSGTHIVQLAAVSSPGQINFGKTDAVFLCVKSQDTDSAMLDLSAVVKDVPVFCFQNGVRNEEIVSKYYPRVYGVMVKAGAVFIREGEVESRGNPPGRFVIGRYPDGTDALVESVAASLRNAGYEVRVTPDIMPYKWGKLVDNLPNAVGAITNAAGEEANRIARASQNEGKEILTQAGIRWIPIEETTTKQPKVVTRANSDLHGEPLGSTWQSLVRRQGTVETEFLNGEIVQIAKKLGKQSPINEALLHITAEMAASHQPPGKYTPAELIRLLKLN
jgi:2-dehydropantoate 2-reductase